MKYKSMSYGVITEKVRECKEFYCLLFEFTVVQELDWYVHLRSPDGAYELGFLEPRQITQPRILQSRYEGRGAWLNFEVENLDDALQCCIDCEVSIEMSVRDEAWGERHFIVRDPAGMAINVMQKTSRDPSLMLP